MMRSRDEVRAQLKALDLDFMKSCALADERLRQVNTLTAQLEGEKEKVRLRVRVRVELRVLSGFKFVTVTAGSLLLRLASLRGLGSWPVAGFPDPPTTCQ
jgi:hypothetical protein